MSRAAPPSRRSSSGIETCVRLIPTLNGLIGQRLMASEGMARITLPRVRALDGDPRYHVPAGSVR